MEPQSQARHMGGDPLGVEPQSHATHLDGDPLGMEPQSRARHSGCGPSPQGRPHSTKACILFGV